MERCANLLFKPYISTNPSSPSRSLRSNSAVSAGDAKTTYPHLLRVSIPFPRYAQRRSTTLQPKTRVYSLIEFSESTDQ